MRGRFLMMAGWLATGLAGAGPAVAQDRLPADLLRRIGGVYATDCANPAAPRLGVLADALVVEQNGQRMMGRKVQAAYSYFGNSPPSNYDVALMSEVRSGPGMELLFIVFKDRRGQYIKLEAGNKVAAALGKNLSDASYRHCESAAAAPPAAAGQTPAPASRAPESPSDLLRDKAFAQAFRAAIGNLASERWIARLDGPAPPLRSVTQDGVSQQVVSVCKPHDCHDSNLVLLYRADSAQVQGKILRAGRPAWVGAPSAARQAVLEQLWREEWRSGK